MQYHLKIWTVLTLFAALSGCMPFTQLLPTATFPVKTHTPIPAIGASSTPLPPSTTPRPLPPSSTPTSTPESCLTVPGAIVKGIITTPQLPKPMSYFVYLPRCYIERPNLRYPVLYLLHGQTYTEDQWIRLGVPTTMDKLIATGEIPPFLIVFPYDYSYLQPTQYAFEDVFMQELLPEIDSTYRTLPSAGRRAVGGLSRGAAWALHLGINHPDVFGAIGAHSPVMFYTDGIRLPLKLKDLSVGLRPHLFLDTGDNDGELEHTLEFKQFLDQNAIPYKWYQFHGFHDEKYWRAHVETYLRWYASNWEK
jgi:enterochelin esterase-like enzyme